MNTILLADVWNVPAPRKDAVQGETCGDETNETEAIDTVTTDMTEARELYMRTMSSSLSVDVCSSDQHKDVTKARQLRDIRDTLDLINFLRERDPFVQNNALINIANGMTAESIINVDRAKQIGKNILESMVDNIVEEFTFRKANEVVTMSSRSAGITGCQ